MKKKKNIAVFKYYSENFTDPFFDENFISTSVNDLMKLLYVSPDYVQLWIENSVLEEVGEKLGFQVLQKNQVYLFFFQNHELFFTPLSAFQSPEDVAEQWNQFRIEGQPFITDDQNMKKILSSAKKMAATDNPVLITGETGTGKELIMKWIVHNSLRKESPFIAVNCAAIPHHLMEAEFFGYRKGAFTGAIQDSPGKFRMADGGTIFLDEVGDISILIQPKLLRVLDYQSIEPLGESRELKVNCRVIAATNSDLETKVLKGEFREDLFYRINVFRLALPPLRERRGDIPLLFEHFMEYFSKSRNFAERFESYDDQLKVLMQYNWPGNVRQLRNLCRNISQTSPEYKIKLSDVTKILGIFSSENSDGSSVFKNNIRKNEKKMIEESLKLFNFQITKTAEYLGISRIHLHRKMKQYEIKNVRKKN